MRTFQTHEESNSLVSVREETAWRQHVVTDKIAAVNVSSDSCGGLRWGGCCRCSSESFPWGSSVRGRSLPCEARCRWSVCWTEASGGESRSSRKGTDTEGGSRPEHEKNKEVRRTMLSRPTVSLRQPPPGLCLCCWSLFNDIY